LATLFEKISPQPLADRMRPEELSDIFGQDHLLGNKGPIRHMIDTKNFSSTIFWGPPGSGKTTIANLLAKLTDYHVENLSAVSSGVADLKNIFQTAQKRHESGVGTLLFVDEIHRFNRSQQDSFLPYVERGTIILFGATTENPSFEINSPLLSRCQVLVLRRLEKKALEKILNRAEEILKKKLNLDKEARDSLLDICDGDGRHLLNFIEKLFFISINEKPITKKDLSTILQKRSPIYDKSRDSHFNLISAFHKSLRGSDVNAALYWLARMLVAGEDPNYIIRRLVRFASEDIGLADPNAVQISIAAWNAYDRLGSPEGELAIAECAIYLASSPKSNSVYKAHNSSISFARVNQSFAPPKHILNAPTSLMKDLDYGKDYIYDHDTKEGFSGQNYFPDGLGREEFYHPGGRGYEIVIDKRLRQWGALRGKIKTKKND